MGMSVQRQEVKGTMGVPWTVKMNLKKFPYRLCLVQKVSGTVSGRYQSPKVKERRDFI